MFNKLQIALLDLLVEFPKARRIIASDIIYARPSE